MPVSNDPSMRIWRVDTGSVHSGIRDVAKKIDREVGNKDGVIASSEVDAFLKTRGSPRDDMDAHAAEALKSYLANEQRLPMWLDATFAVTRRPLTAFSDWIGRAIMGP
jgi:hypothetical protein